MSLSALFRPVALGLLVGAARAHGFITLTLAAPPGPLDVGAACVFRAELEPPVPGVRFTWTVLENGILADAGHGAQLEDRPDGTLAFRAGPGSAGRTFTVRLRARFDAEGPDIVRQAEVQVRPGAEPGAPGWRDPDQPLPRPLVELILAYCDARALELRIRMQSGPPFRHPVHEAGLFVLASSLPWPDWAPPLQINGTGAQRIVGYGCPARFTWTRPAPGARQLLSFFAPQPGREEETLCAEVPAEAAALTRTFTEPVQLAQLETQTPDGDAWRSEIAQGILTVRGLMPLAGNLVAGPGHQDGRGPAARLQAPMGLAALAGAERPDLVTGQGDPCQRWLCAVADPGAHALRIICADSAVLTLGGDPGQPGFRNGPLNSARFDAPTFILAGEPVHTWHDQLFLGYPFLVSDTGNHCLRQVSPEGEVETLAGDRTAGWRDGDAAQARFDRPMGLAQGPDLAVYVADAGNAVIRRIRNGVVDTLAGQAGSRGAADGPGGQARFTELRGLALDDIGQALYAADGHAIRKLALNPDGSATVTTVLGRVDRPGFQATRMGSAAELRQPCLDTPWGLACCSHFLWIADRGNHAVRAYLLQPDPAALLTLAGDPGRPAPGPGLLRDSIEHLPESGYGTLLAPGGIAVTRAGRGTAYVTTGPGVMQLTGAGAFPMTVSFDPLAAQPLQLMAPAGAGAGQPFRMGLGLEEGAATGDYRYTADFIEADGSLGMRRQGEGSATASPLVVGEFEQPGAGTVRVTAVSPEGISVQAERVVTVR